MLGGMHFGLNVQKKYELLHDKKKSTWDGSNFSELCLTISFNMFPVSQLHLVYKVEVGSPSHQLVENKKKKLFADYLASVTFSLWKCKIYCEKKKVINKTVKPPRLCTWCFLNISKTANLGLSADPCLTADIIELTQGVIGSSAHKQRVLFFFTVDGRECPLHAGIEQRMMLKGTGFLSVTEAGLAGWGWLGWMCACVCGGGGQQCAL